MRNIISQLSIDNGIVSCKDKSGKPCSIQKTQGDLDGACATYCVVMNLLILQVIYDSDTRVDSKPKDKNTKKLIKTFFSEYGMHHNGQTYFKIRKMLLASFGNVVDCKHYVPAETEITLDIIKTHIDSNLPVIISVSYRGGGGHALLAVGYEESDEGVSKLLCLDPGSPKVGNRRWNATLGIHFEKRGTYIHNYGDEDVSLDDILVISTIE